MTNFNGITPKAIELLSENRFNDSKAFYEEHKEELKQLATIPMRQIVLDLAEMMTELDDKMYTDPVYTVSRIRRDTRRSKSKMMYRENLWLMLRRHKKQYPCAPFFWFEFSPVCYTMGLGFFVQKPAQFDAKDMSFSYTGWNLEHIGSTALIDELKAGFAAAFPLYKIFIEAYENMLSEGLIDDE